MWGGNFVDIVCAYNHAIFKGTAMQIEKSLINDHLFISKVSRIFCILTIFNFAVMYLWNLPFT